jgi:hypothetical protein
MHADIVDAALSPYSQQQCSCGVCTQYSIASKVGWCYSAPPAQPMLASMLVDSAQVLGQLDSLKEREGKAVTGTSSVYVT